MITRSDGYVSLQVSEDDWRRILALLAIAAGTLTRQGVEWVEATQLLKRLTEGDVDSSQYFLTLKVLIESQLV